MKHAVAASCVSSVQCKSDVGSSTEDSGGTLRLIEGFPCEIYELTLLSNFTWFACV